MLSYQHSYHAGNPADIHKHLVLNLILASLNQKDKPWSYLETHSGRGWYDLADSPAQKNQEFQSGIEKLSASTTASDCKTQLAFALAHFSEKRYPGSPAQALHHMREKDVMHLIELHPEEIRHLKKNLRDPRVHIHHRDAYEGLIALLPPNPRRGLVLIDPAYEDKNEYQDVVDLLEAACERWPIGVFAVWYPVLPAALHEDMVRAISSRVAQPILQAQWQFAEKPLERGMYGSGMLLINPPWKLDSKIETCHQFLNEALTETDYPNMLKWLRAAP